MSVSRYFLYRFSAVALVGLSVPAFAAAQHGGMGGGGAVGHAGAPMGHAGTVVMHAAPVGHGASAGSAPRAVVRAGSGTGSAVRIGLPGRTRTGVRNARHINNFNNEFEDTNFNDVPGLGFDFPHLAAVNSGRHHRRNFFGGVPFFDGGFLFGSPSVIIEQPAPAEAQPEADDAVAGDAVESAPIRRPRRMYEAEANPAPPAAQPEPERQIEQYVFVKRDGGLEYAVAYSWIDGTLRYITPDGRRHTLGRDALDLNATQQMNEQRGVEFHAPA